jgi:riboflavin biosynthesis pyrimidine reductase
VYVLCPASVASAVELPGARVVGIDSPGMLSGRSIVDALGTLGFHSIACEGGPTLAGQLIAEGLVDELCLSTSPLIGGLLTPPLPGAGRADVALTQLLVDDASVSYARWFVSLSEAAPPATG